MDIFETKVKEAYENNELYLLFSGDKKYSCDQKGESCLRPYISKYEMGSCDELDIIDIPQLIQALAFYAYSFERHTGMREKISEKLKETIAELINSNQACNIYHATKMYYALITETSKAIFHPFKNILNDVKNQVEEKLIENKTELSNTFIYEGKIDNRGLWNQLKLMNKFEPENFRLTCLMD